MMSLSSEGCGRNSGSNRRGERRCPDIARRGWPFSWWSSHPEKRAHLLRSLHKPSEETGRLWSCRPSAPTVTWMGAVSEPIQFHGVTVLIEPESVKYALDQLCKRAGVHVSLHTMLLSATRNGDHITSVTLHDHGGNHEVSAKAFVDASGEGDLAFFGGASVRYGNHGIVQTGTL